MTKSLIVHVQVKEVATKIGMPNVSANFYTELENKVNQIIVDSCNRAKKNSRNTVMGKDV